MQQKTKIPFLMFSIILLIFTVLSSIHYRAVPKWIDWKSFEIADTLIQHGIFTNGGNARYHLPGNAFPPGYPALIASLSLATPSLTDNLHCLAKMRRKCQQQTLSRTLITLQVIAALITLLLVYLLAWEISHSSEISVLTLILFMFSGTLAKFSQSLLPFVFITLFIMTSSYFLLLAFTRQSNLYCLLAGIFTALTSLFFPPFALALLFISIALFIANKVHSQTSFIPSLALLVGASLIVGPWMLRNQLLLNELAITHDSSIRLLASRVAYNNMSFEEWLASFILWLPLIGENLADLIFSPNIINRLGYGSGSLSADQQIIIGAASMSGQRSDHYIQIVSSYIAGDIYHYIATLPPLFVRSIWGGSTIGLFGILFLWPLRKRLRSSGNIASFGLVFTSLSSYLLAQSLLSAPNNPHHYNGHILFLYAYAIAHISGGLEMPKALRPKRRMNTPSKPR